MADKVKILKKQLREIDEKLAVLEEEKSKYPPVTIDEIEELEQEEADLLSKLHQKKLELLNLKHELRRKEFSGMKGSPKPGSFLVSSSIRFSVSSTQTRNPQVHKSIKDDQDAEVSKWEINEEEIIIDKNRVLGKGSFGDVFAGTCRGKDVAVKILNNDVSDTVLDDFKNEVAVMAKLRHENLLLFMGVCTQHGKLQIVTELMPKGSVHFLLREKPGLTMKRKMLIAIDTALGMFWLHQTQILHLDLKPANLLVNDNWLVKVADFGISQMREDLDSIGGTLNYMSPEILMGGDVDEKADVYSFGLVLWELVTEKVPWRTELNTLEEYKSTVGTHGKRPAIPSTCPPKLQQLIEKCWQQEPKARPTFAEIIESNVFHEIIINDVIKDTEGKKLWTKKFLGRYEIPWKKFLEGFCSYLGIPVPKDITTDKHFICLKATIADNIKEEVSIEEFANFLVWFGPLTPGSGILENLFEFVKTKAFWGKKSADEAEKVLTQAKSQAYLIRFSASDPGNFVVSCKTKKDTYVHYPIQHKPNSKYTFADRSFDSIGAIIQEFKKKLGLRYPASGSPYQELLGHLELDHSQMVGYMDPNIPKKGKITIKKVKANQSRHSGSAKK